MVVTRFQSVAATPVVIGGGTAIASAAVTPVVMVGIIGNRSTTLVRFVMPRQSIAHPRSFTLPLLSMLLHRLFMPRFQWYMPQHRSTARRRSFTHSQFTDLIMATASVSGAAITVDSGKYH